MCKHLENDFSAFLFIQGFMQIYVSPSLNTHEFFKNSNMLVIFLSTPKYYRTIIDNKFSSFILL